MKIIWQVDNYCRDCDLLEHYCWIQTDITGTHKTDFCMFEISWNLNCFSFVSSVFLSILRTQQLISESLIVCSTVDTISILFKTNILFDLQLYEDE